MLILLLQSVRSGSKVVYTIHYETPTDKNESFRLWSLPGDLRLFMVFGSLIKDLLRAWKVLGRHYLKSENFLDETHREEISQPAVKNLTFLASLGSWGHNRVISDNI